MGGCLGGVDRLDPAQGSVTHYRHEPGNERSLASNNIACLYQDRAGTYGLGPTAGLTAWTYRPEVSCISGTIPGTRQSEQR